MDGLIRRMWLLTGLASLVGALILVAPGDKSVHRTEGWMESKAPSAVAGFHFIPSSANPEQSYRMDDRTYVMLAPFGIVCRVYELGSTRYDVVLIASNNRGSFHDPRVCFSGQGWNFDAALSVQIPTATRGLVPATLIAGDADRTGRRYAVYFYRGPGGFSASTLGIKWRLLKQLLEHPLGGSGEGVFYRFITTDAEQTPDELLAFVGQYMDAAGSASGGYF